MAKISGQNIAEESKKKLLKVALAGNPNSGKTTIFNNLTGARQHVANYPGVTVDIKEGIKKYKGVKIQIIDLPGAYSLTAYSTEEIIARNYIIDNKPDVIVNVVDASNLERNLYLSVQLIEMAVPIIVVFNQSDIAKKRGLSFDLKKLSVFLGAPIVYSIGHKNIGTADILDKILEVGKSPLKNIAISYGKDIDSKREKLKVMLGQCKKSDYVCENASWVALKLLENDEAILKQIENQSVVSQDITKCAFDYRMKLEKLYGVSSEMLIADQRYGFISGACRECVRLTAEQRHNMSDKIDAFVINKFIGIPLFLLLMYFMFYLTFTVGAIPMGWLEKIFSWLAQTVNYVWPTAGGSMLKNLIVEGIIGGVGGVLTFLPNIMLLFLSISILEDSGYMARAAFLMDRFMTKIGLHGKSFIPMLTGFGCSVPGIMATRTLEHKHDRLTTMMVLPFMSCGARLPIYTLILPAFFPEHMRAPLLWVIYLLGIIVAVVCAKLLRLTLFKGEQDPFVIELPPYRMPTLKSVLIHMWEKGWMYIKKAGTILLGISIVLWAFTAFPIPPEKLTAGLSPAKAREIELSYSVSGRIGKELEPLLKPIGFDWKIGTALMCSLAAKEVFVAQLGVLFSTGEDNQPSLREKLSASYSSLTAFCIMIFCLLSSPCVATFAVIKKESGKWRWAFFQFFGMGFIAYIVSFMIYQIGCLFNIGV
ncbi:ferrous iron transport protein B [bacterium]|nr:ferrous iron transport protein B [bacterium]